MFCSVERFVSCYERLLGRCEVSESAWAMRNAHGSKVSWRRSTKGAEAIIVVFR